MERFYTIENDIQTEIIEKKSRFIANLFYVENTKQAEEIIKKIKKKYHDAKHNCIAYRVIENEQLIEKSSDDGEPSGTAGIPMLSILQKKELYNILIIVTRYFGGILLGTGGLVRAYSDSLLKALENSNILIKYKSQEIQVEVAYSEFEKFKYYCKKNNINIIKIEYEECIKCIILLDLDKKQYLLKDYNTKNILIKNIKDLSIKYATKSI